MAEPPTAFGLQRGEGFNALDTWTPHVGNRIRVSRPFGKTTLLLAFCF